MLAYSKRSLKSVMLTLLSAGAMIFPASVYAQNNQAGTITGVDTKKVETKVNTVAADSAGSGKNLDKAGEIAEEQRKPVPVLEDGDYSFDQDAASNEQPNEKEPNKVINKYDDEETKPKPTEYDIGGEDAFFDTEQIAPKGKVGHAGPAPVDPKKTPASKFVIVETVSPKNTKSAKLVSAERAMSLGRLDSALQFYDELYAENKKDPAVLMGRSVCLQKLGRFDEAMESYDELSKIRPKDIEVKINMLGLLSTRYPAIALRRLLDLHDQNPDNVGIVAQIAVTAGNLGDTDTALRFLGMAMGMQPQNASHLYNAAVILDRAGKTKDAIGYYEKALEVDSVYGGNRSIPRDAIYERLAKLR